MMRGDFLQSGVWIAIYLPIFVLLFIIVPMQRKGVMHIRKIRKRKGVLLMSNELIKNSVGRVCNITGGSLGSNLVKATIVEVEDNWMKVEAKGKEYLINIDFIQSIVFVK